MAPQLPELKVSENQPSKPDEPPKPDEPSKPDEPIKFLEAASRTTTTEMLLTRGDIVLRAARTIDPGVIDLETSPP